MRFERALVRELTGLGLDYEVTSTVNREALAEQAQLARRFRLVMASSAGDPLTATSWRRSSARGALLALAGLAGAWDVKAGLALVG